LAKSENPVIAINRLLFGIQKQCFLRGRNVIVTYYLHELKNSKSYQNGLVMSTLNYVPLQEHALERRSIHSFIHQWFYSPLLGRDLFFSFVIFFTQTVGLLGRVISPSQGRNLDTGQHKHKINEHTDIHALSRIRTRDPSVRATEDSSCLRPSDHRNRRVGVLTHRCRFMVSLTLPTTLLRGNSSRYTLNRKRMAFGGLSGSDG
jgi:hypothetical protein